MCLSDVYIVNYCHRNCVPLQNIMLLPKEQAFSLAKKMADQNKNTTAFYRFADFENYYYERLQTDELLYHEFLTLGGNPTLSHPFSFVLQGSELLYDWFDRGIIIKIPLNQIPSDQISFTYGDSMTSRKQEGKFTMFNKTMLQDMIAQSNDSAEVWMNEMNRKWHYIEVQVWDNHHFHVFNQ